MDIKSGFWGIPDVADEKDPWPLITDTGGL